MRIPDDKREWLTALLGEHEAALGRYAARIVGDSQCARDVVQEAFLRLWKSGPAGAGDNPAAWLFTVCRNLCFDHLRKERRMVPLAQEEMPAVADPRDPGDGPQEEMAQVLKALARLPASQQEVIRLKFQGGLSYKDISRVTGYSVSNVGVLIHTGVKTLRAALARRDDAAASPSGDLSRGAGVDDLARRRSSTKGGAP